MPSPWVILGLKTDSSAEDIRRRYRSLALQWHPDKNLDRQEFATNRMIEIQDAYEKILNNDDARATVRGSSVPTPFSYTTPKAYSNWNYTQGQAQRPKRKEKPKPRPQSKAAAKPKAAPKPNARPKFRPTPVAKQSEPVKPTAAAPPVNVTDPAPSAVHISAAKARVNMRARAKAKADAEKTPPLSSATSPPADTVRSPQREKPSSSLTFRELSEMCRRVVSCVITVETRARSFIHRYETLHQHEHCSLMSDVLSRAVMLRRRVERMTKRLQDRWVECLHNEEEWFERIEPLQDMQGKAVHWYDRSSDLALQLDKISSNLRGYLDRELGKKGWMEELELVRSIALVAKELK